MMPTPMAGVKPLIGEEEAGDAGGGGEEQEGGRPAIQPVRRQEPAQHHDAGRNADQTNQGVDKGEWSHAQFGHVAVPFALKNDWQVQS